MHSALKRENSTGRVRWPFDPDCLRFVVPLGVVGALGWIFAAAWLWLPCLILVAAILAFFRDPPRTRPRFPGAVVSPADGKIVAIEDNADPAAGPVPGRRVIVFLSVLDVHVNRAPCAGIVEHIRYQPGQFLNALGAESSEMNESNWIFMRSGSWPITVRQVAGLIARRIVCRVREGQRLALGQRLGLIRFGSRTELFLPPEAEIKVALGDKVKGAESVIAVLPDSSEK